MAEEKIIRCNGCNKIVPEDEAKDWLHLDLFIRRGLNSPQEKLDFDSYECIGRYAKRKADDQRAE